MDHIGRNVKSLNTLWVMKCIATLFFTIALIGFEALSTINDNTIQYVTDASFQRTRSQILVKSALVLLYRPKEERTSAISDLETVLPLFEQEQAVLLGNPASDVQLLLTQARPDYLALDQAVTYILANQASAIDLIQVNIILAHERNYLITTNTLLVVLNQHAHTRAYHFFLIEMSISIVIMLFIIGCIIVTKHIVKRILHDMKVVALRPDENVGGI